MENQEDNKGGDFKKDTVRVVLKEEDLLALVTGKVAKTTGMFQGQERPTEIILGDIGVGRIIDLLIKNTK
jgi:hypothetical protein